MIWSYAPLIGKGMLITLAAWVTAGAISFVLGTIMGIASCRQLVRGRWNMFFNLYTFIAKGVPAYVQILIAYFVIPGLLGINISGYLAAVGALAFCSSGYVAEIVRAGINALPRGQWDACFVLGYPMPATIWRIILPQTLGTIMPSLVGEFEQLLKSTSLLATIGVTELTRSGVNIISREMNPIPVYLMIALIYLLFSALLQVISAYIQQRGYYAECS